MILALMCAATALWFISCGGAGSTEVIPAATAGFSLSSTSLVFADQGVGSASGPLISTLANVGNGTLVFTSIQVEGPDAKDFSMADNCGSGLAPSAHCTIAVRFVPTAHGTRKAQVVFTDNSAGSPQRLNLTGTGIAPAVSLSATSLAFGSQLIGATSPTRTITLSNSGAASLSITSISTTDTNLFSVTNTCGSVVAAGQSCTISVAFTPTAIGVRTATLTIRDDSDNVADSEQSVNLTGTGTGPVAEVTPSTLTFANQTLNTTSTAQTVTLSNTGSVALSISGIAMTGSNAGDFAQTNTCGSSVAAGGTCTLRVTFTPTAGGSRTASLSISDNASGSPQVVSLTGAGTGSVAVSLSPSSLSFASQAVATTSAAQTATLSNTGSAALSISGIAMTGTNPGDFAETANTCGSSVAAGGSCTIEVTFTPSAAGARAATLSLADNASTSPQGLSLTGTGSPDVILSWGASPSSGVVGYNVYRGTTSGGESSTPLNATPINGTSYIDENVTPGTTYYYVLTSVGANGVQSAPSNETAATVPVS